MKNSEPTRGADPTPVPGPPRWLVEDVLTPTGVPLPYFLTQLTTLWPDLASSRQIQLDTAQGVANTLAYWEHPLRHQSPDINWPANGHFPTLLNEADPNVLQDTVLPITNGLTAILRVRPDMQGYEADTAHGRARFLHWRLTLGCREYRFLRFTPKEIAYLKAPIKWLSWGGNRLPRLARLLAPLYADRFEMRDRLLAGDPDLMAACWAEAGHMLMQALDNAQMRPDSDMQVAPPTALGELREGGVNVIGFATGQFGVGEDARMATRALLQAGHTPCVYEPPIPLASAHRQSGWINQHMQSAPTFKFNLITLPAVDTLRLLFLQQAHVLASRYNICGWQWELPKWPRKWQGLMALPDEIWAQSRFLETMFREATDKPVTYIPSAVEIPPFTPRSRQALGLPAGPYAFLSVFDCNGWYQRKNPLAAVRAFQLAFPRTNREVQLIVKMMNSRPDVPEHQALIQLASQDDRICIIDQFLSREDMLALLNSTDVFVSLHRSEGFGRVVAECMLLGKPVISTNYSGSLDFAHEGTAYVVDGPLIPLDPGDYADHEGQSWMDPDIALAADAMRRCLHNPAATAAMALLGQAHIRQHHSLAAVAEQYTRRLQELGLCGRTT
jgi:glycosyltransferase involved in cell wall biosynthesis